MYEILTDDRKTKGYITSWATIEKDNIAFLKQVIDYFKTYKNANDFILYDTETNKVYKMIDVKIAVA